MKRTGTAWKCLLALAAAAVAALSETAVAGDAWFSGAWPYRRPVTVAEAAPTRLEGDDIAYVTMMTGGLAKPDGSDIRVASPAGQEMPSRVLMTGPGDQATVAFALQPKEKTYYVYFGNPAAGTAKPLEIRRGVLMEVWDYNGRPVRTFSQMQEIFDSPGEPLGRCFQQGVFLGYNPFGPSNRIAVRYTGYLVCPWSGNYIFCTSSQDASFLTVDDKLVVENGGRHGPQREPRQTGQIELQSGLHKLTVYQACSGNWFPVIIAAWQPPGAMQIKPIPSSAFARAVEAQPQAMEERYQGVAVDFVAVHAGEAGWEGAQTQRYSFKAVTGNTGGQPPAVLWNFGDGQTSRQATVDHVYLTAGDYTVTLTVRTASGGEYKRVNRLAISRPWTKLADEAHDEMAQHAAIVAGYDLAGLGDEALAAACRLFQQTDRPADVMRAAEALFQRNKAHASPAAAAMYADAMSAGGQPAKAAEAMLQAAKQVETPEARAALLVRAGQLFLEAGTGADQAMSAFGEAAALLGSSGRSGVLRSAHIGMGDVWRLRGDGGKALAEYQAAGTASADSPVMAEVRQGDMARHVEAYLRDKDYKSAEDYLARWADAAPADKLEGYWSLLRVKAFLAQDRNTQAAAEARTLVAANPSSPYAPQLLALAAEAYTKLSQPEQAMAMRKQLLEKYPESPLAAEASKKAAAP
ncbi:MAG: PKD domain-containing protein [Phycisphaerae bacterium]|jgi:tetratricopeptide (TPR) repeat protein